MFLNQDPGCSPEKAILAKAKDLFFDDK